MATRRPPSVHRILISLEAAAALVDGSRSEVRAVLEAAGIVRVTPWGPRVLVSDIEAWAANLPTTVTAAIPADVRQQPRRAAGLVLKAGGTLDAR